MTEALQAVPIPLCDIVAGPNDRTTFNEAELADLAADIRKNGLIQPITVRPWQGRYQIVAGERRFRAHQVAGLPTILAYIRDLTDQQADSLMLAENIGRKDLDPIDEARAIAKRMERYGWTPKQAAEELHLSESRVKTRLALLRLIPDAQHLVRTGQLPIGHAESMQALDKNFQLIALRAFSTAVRAPTRNQFAALCGELEAKQNQATLFDLAAYTAESSDQPTQFVQSKKFRITLGGIRIEITLHYRPGGFLGALFDEENEAVESR